MTQYGMAKVVRPDLTALSLRYQGKASSIPIAWPGVKDTLSDDVLTAGQTNIVAGTPTPLGSKVFVWIPQFLRWTSEVRGSMELVPYAWRFVWRLRNPEYYTKMQQKGQQTAGYHFPSVRKLSGYVTIPSAVDAGIYVGQTGTPPFDAASVQQLSQVVEKVENWYQPRATVLGNTFSIGGADRRPLDSLGAPLYLEQGSTLTAYNQIMIAGWNIVELTALGDDLVILQSADDTSGTWDFTDVYKDQVMYQTLTDNPDFGVYVLIGDGANSSQVQNNYVNTAPT